MRKKIQLLDKMVKGGDRLLDIGAGTGEWIDLEKHKFRVIYGIDVDDASINICRSKFANNGNIHLLLCGIDDISIKIPLMDFNYITCLDVLEHIPEMKLNGILKSIYNIMDDQGKFIFTGPGIFEKMRIALGRSPTHLHSHSSYGWQNILGAAGFKVIKTESVEFPIFKSDALRKKAHILGKCCVIMAEKE